MVCLLAANIHCMYLVFNSSRLHVVYRDIVYYLGGDLHISCHTMQLFVSFLLSFIVLLNLSVLDFLFDSLFLCSY